MSINYVPTHQFPTGRPAEGSAVRAELQNLGKLLGNASTGVASVFGRTGAVVAASNDYTWGQIDKTTSSIADIATKSHTLLTDKGTNTHAQIDSHISSTSNPHTVTYTQVGAIQNANDTVKDTHIDWGTGASQVSAGDVPIADAGGIITGTEVETALQENRTAINLNTTHRGSDGKDHSDVVLNNTHRGLTNNPHSVTKAQVGLTNVENTALSTWAGSANIVTVGTIGTGTWQATDVGVAHGGTGQSTAQAAINALTAVSAATNEHVLTKDTGTGNATWKAVPSGFADPMTTRGDIIYRDSSNTTTRLAAGAASTYLKSNGTDISYSALPDATDSVKGIASFNALNYGVTSGAVAPKFDGCILYNSVNETHNSSGGWFALTWNTESEDTNSYHSTSTNTSRVSITVTGKYLFIGTVEFDTHATGYRGVAIRVDGTNFYLGNYTLTNSGGHVVCQVVREIGIASGSYAELVAFQNSGGNLTLYGAVGHCGLEVKYLGT